MNEAPLEALVYPEVEVFKDTIIDDQRHLSIYIHSKRGANRMEMFADSLDRFMKFNVNGLDLEKDDEGLILSRRWGNRLFGYHITDNEPLELEIAVPINQETNLILYESSNDLLTHRTFDVKKRSDNMITKPFILNDAVILKKNITIE